MQPTSNLRVVRATHSLFFRFSILFTKRVHATGFLCALPGPLATAKKLQLFSVYMASDAHITSRWARHFGSQAENSADICLARLSELAEDSTGPQHSMSFFRVTVELASSHALQQWTVPTVQTQHRNRSLPRVQASPPLEHTGPVFWAWHCDPLGPSSSSFPLPLCLLLLSVWWFFDLTSSFERTSPWNLKLCRVSATAPAGCTLCGCKDLLSCEIGCETERIHLSIFGTHHDLWLLEEFCLWHVQASVFSVTAGHIEQRQHISDSWCRREEFL